LPPAPGRRSTLEAADLQFDGPTCGFGGMVRIATFFDPVGNALMVYQGLGGR